MQFPVLDAENIVQINDKTRLDVTKSFVSKDADAFVKIEVTPELSASAIDVYDTDRTERYLDWIYSDLTTNLDSTNNKIYFSVGVTNYTATVTPGTYTFSTLATAMGSAMNTTYGSSVFTVAVSTINYFTISASVSFKLNGQNTLEALLPHIGFKSQTLSGTSFTGLEAEYVIKKITVTITGPTATPPEDTVITSKVFYIKVISKEGDKLFSADSDLIAFEANILKWVNEGRASFLDVHRKAQTLILKWLEQNDYCLDDGTPITKKEVVDISEVSDWACFMVLRLIFSSIHNDPDDVFKEKAKEYEKFEIGARNKAIMKFDLNKDGVVDNNEIITTFSGNLFRR